MTMNSITATLLVLAHAISYGSSFQPASPFFHRSLLTTASSSSASLPSASASSLYASTEQDQGSTATATTISKSEIQTLYSLLSDSTLLFDPSRGQCCRNKCSGCVYLDDDGNFIFDEYTAESEMEGFLPPYVKVDFGNRVHVSKWSEVLFPNGAKEVERSDFADLLDSNGNGNSDSNKISDRSIQALWTVLSPSAGYPRLSPTEVIRAIKGMEGSMYDKGGAVDYAIFEQNILKVAEILGDGMDNAAVDDIPDYDAMEKEELLQLCQERGMKTNFPKMKRIIIEELRFFDVHGRQGKRHPVKNTLS